MVKQRLFLGSVAFGISFGISFLTGRDLGRAIASGVTTTVAAVAASVVVDRQSHQQAHTRIADLKNHIQALQQRRAEAYYAYRQLEDEKEQLAASLQTLAVQPDLSYLPHQPQLSAAPLPRALPAAYKALSWDLSAPASSEPSIAVRPYELPTEIPDATSAPWGHQTGNPAEGESNQQMRSDAAVTKQKIEANLTALQAELSQIKGQITDHRQTREKLSRDIANVREEKRQLEATAKTLKSEVQDLETCRVELEQFLSYAEAKKQELETGSSPLQVALKQLQAQVDSLQEELRVLEAQILDRRSQKDVLEQQLAALSATEALTAPLHPSTQATISQPNGKAQTNSNGSSNAEAHAKTTIAIHEPLPKPQVRRPDAIAPTHQPLPSNGAQPTVATLQAEPIAVEQATADLPHEWTEFMVQLPEYELQALKVIVEQNRPAAALKHLAEENLTMPELLIDSINERALDTIGDLLIDAGAGAGSAVIVRDHLKTVKKLLKTYEYLVN